MESESQGVSETTPVAESETRNGQPRSETENSTGELEEECEGAIEELLARIEHLERRVVTLENEGRTHREQYEHTLKRQEQPEPRQRHWYLRKIGE